jgi:hypothetical protein
VHVSVSSAYSVVRTYGPRIDVVQARVQQADASLVSSDCVAARERCGGADTSLVSMEWFSLGATLSIPYDSLIEKCSTLPVVRA